MRAAWRLKHSEERGLRPRALFDGSVEPQFPAFRSFNVVKIAGAHRGGQRLERGLPEWRDESVVTHGEAPLH